MEKQAQEVILYHLDFRPLAEADLELLYAWRQDKEVMRYLPSAQPVIWREHLHWFFSRPKERLDFMVIFYEMDMNLVALQRVEKRRVGTVHVLPDGEVGLLIGDKSVWGKGVGKNAVEMAIKQVHPRIAFFAVIHPENIASQHVFAACGFVNTHQPARNGQERWEYR